MLKSNIKFDSGQVRLAGIAHNSLVNGNGLRIVIFSQGCNHHCKGCFNKDTWDFKKGKLYDIAKIEKEILDASDYLEGITFSGGDPIEQIDKFLPIINFIKKNTKLNIWLFTGYVWDELLKKSKLNNNLLLALNKIDVIMDGRFDITKLTSNEKDPDIYKYRGSTNQCCIDVKKSLKQNKKIIFNKFN